MYPYYPWDDVPWWARGTPEAAQNDPLSWLTGRWNTTVYDWRTDEEIEQAKARSLLARNGEDTW